MYRSLLATWIAFAIGASQSLAGDLQMELMVVEWVPSKNTKAPSHDPFAIPKNSKSRFSVKLLIEAGKEVSGHASVGQHSFDFETHISKIASDAVTMENTTMTYAKEQDPPKGILVSENGHDTQRVHNGGAITILLGKPFLLGGSESSTITKYQRIDIGHGFAVIFTKVEKDPK